MENKNELKKYVRSVLNMLKESWDESTKEEQLISEENKSISKDDSSDSPDDQSIVK